MSRTARAVMPLLVLLVGGADVVRAQSVVVQMVGGEKIKGKILATSPNDVEIEVNRGTSVRPKLEERRLPVTDIRELSFAGEPDDLGSARGALLKFDAAGAISDLAKLEPADLEGAEPLVLVDVDFVRAVALGRSARQPPEIDAAEKALRAFLGKHVRSHHVYTVQETLGDLLARAGRFDDAAAAYAALDKGPAALRVRGAALRAGLFYQQKKYAEARREFETASKIGAEEWDRSSFRQKLEAELGAARCMIRLGAPAEAAALAGAVLTRAGADDREVPGLAYLVLGDAQRAAGNEQDALLAFLTIDMVHNQVPDLHAEALANLVELWERAKNPERARAARRTLETSYPDSPWTRKLPPADAS